MLREARLAAAIAAVLGDSSLQAESLINLANALRIKGSLRAARKILRQAERLVGGDDFLNSEFLAVVSAVQFAEGDAEGGVLTLRRTIQLRERTGDFKDLAALLIKLAMCVSEADPKDALRITSRAIRLLGDRSQHRLLLIAHHNACDFLLMLGLPGVAYRVFEKLESLYETFRDEPSLQGRRWLLAGRLALGVGFEPRAREHFFQAVDLLKKAGLWQQVAIAYVQLAGLTSTPLTEQEDLKRKAAKALALADRATTPVF